MRAKVIRRHGRVWLKRPRCACAMNHLGKLDPCFPHFGAGLLKSRDYLLRAWREYEAEAEIAQERAK